MDLASQVSEILSEAERKLADLAARALQQRDYTTVQWLSAIAERIASGNIDHQEKNTHSGSEGSSAATRDKSADQRLFTRQELVHPEASTAADKPFPHFYRDDNQLIKIGYSKSDRRTYEHRSPGEVLERLSKCLTTIASEGQLFTTEDILKQFEREAPVVPNYQIYLCLGFLVRTSIVQKNGRLGYKVDPNHRPDIAASARAQWKTLPVR